MSRDRFLAAAVELFEETGEWPKVEWVQRELVRWRDTTNAKKEARRLPRRLGDLNGDRVELGVRAIHQTEPGSSDLEAFQVALREAWISYRNRDRQRDPLLSVADLMNKTFLSEMESWRAMKLLAAEGLIKKSTERVWEIVPAIRHYRSIRTVEAYLRRKQRFERRRCFRQVVSKPVALGRYALRPGGWVRVVVLSVLATLIAALLLWVGKELFASPPADDSPKATRQVARE